MSDGGPRHAGRRTELLEQAAEASRAGLHTRRERIIATARPILQSAVAAAGRRLRLQPLLRRARRRRRRARRGVALPAGEPVAAGGREHRPAARPAGRNPGGHRRGAVGRDRAAVDAALAAVAEAPQAITTLADSARALRAYLEGGDGAPARQAAARAAALANAVIEETSDLSALNIVGQVRMTAVDLLRASGFERSRAQHVVRTADAERLEH